MRRAWLVIWRWARALSESPQPSRSGTSYPVALGQPRKDGAEDEGPGQDPVEEQDWRGTALLRRRVWRRVGWPVVQGDLTAIYGDSLVWGLAHCAQVSP